MRLRLIIIMAGALVWALLELGRALQQRDALAAELAPLLEAKRQKEETDKALDEVFQKFQQEDAERIAAMTPEQRRRRQLRLAEIEAIDKVEYGNLDP